MDIHARIKRFPSEGFAVCVYRELKEIDIGSICDEDEYDMRSVASLSYKLSSDVKRRDINIIVEYDKSFSSGAEEEIKRVEKWAKEYGWSVVYSE